MCLHFETPPKNCGFVYVNLCTIGCVNIYIEYSKQEYFSFQFRHMLGGFRSSFNQPVEFPLLLFCGLPVIMWSKKEKKVIISNEMMDRY